VLVESLSKRVDVPALKSQLDVRDAQVMASVIAEIEVEVLPYLGSPPSNPKIGEVDDELDELEDEDYDFPTVLGEGAKDALARSLRKSEVRLNQMFQMRRLPLRIHRLNGLVFWCILGIASSASIGSFVEYALIEVPYWVEVTAIAAPLTCAALAIAFAVGRHLKVQSAEENIIDTSS
jgi:hypothetical protein